MGSTNTIPISRWLWSLCTLHIVQCAVCRLSQQYPVIVRKFSVSYSYCEVLFTKENTTIIDKGVKKNKSICSQLHRTITSPIIGCYTPLIQCSTVHFGSMMCCSKRTITWSILLWSIELGSCGIVIHWNKNSYLLSLTSIPWLNFYLNFNWELLIWGQDL